MAAGCHSALSVGLPVHESAAGALNIYATEPHTFDSDAVELAQTFAGYAAVPPANAHLHDTQTALARQPQTTMANRAVIEQTKGVLMGDRRWSAASPKADNRRHGAPPKKYFSRKLLCPQECESRRLIQPFGNSS